MLVDVLYFVIGDRQYIIYVQCKVNKFSWKNILSFLFDLFA